MLRDILTALSVFVIALVSVAHADATLPPAAWQTQCAARFERARAQLVKRDSRFDSMSVTVAPFPFDSERAEASAPSVFFAEWVSHGDTIVAVVWDRGRDGKATRWHVPASPSYRQLDIVRERGRLAAALSMSFGRDNTSRQLKLFRAAFQPAIDDCLNAK
jgi:hypothetical protein